MSDEVVSAIAEAQRRKDARIWEEGFRAGQQAAGGDGRIVPPKNPYGAPEDSGPPEFPEFWIRNDEPLTFAMDRWAIHMRDFKAAWDEWSAAL
jgi:hypothetical protein